LPDIESSSKAVRPHKTSLRPEYQDKLENPGKPCISLDIGQQRSPMRYSKITVAAGVVLLTLIFLIPVSCVSKPHLAGKWREAGKTAALEFYKDGAFKAVDNQGMAVSGLYTLSRDGRIKFEIQRDGITKETVMLNIEVKEDNLRLASLDGSDVEIYLREK
jgi:hypothetical protein